MVRELLKRQSQTRALQSLWRGALLALLCLLALPSRAQEVDETKVITMTTAKSVGEQIGLGIEADGSVRIEGVQEAMTSLVEQLPQISIPEDEKNSQGYFIVVDRKNSDEGNHLSQASATLAKNKDWKVHDYNNGKDADDNDNDVGIPYNNF